MIASAPAAPSGPPRTSALAVASLVIGLFLCLPLGLVAVGLGGLALSRIKRSNGALGGSAYAMTGLGFGLFNLALTAVLATAVLASGDEFGLTSGPTPPVVTAPVVPAPTRPAPPAPRAGAADDEDGQMTTIDQVTETPLGPNAWIVDVPPTTRTLKAELAEQQKKVRPPGKLVVFTTNEHCRPCFGAAIALDSEAMRQALQGSRVVRVDGELLGPELVELGIPIDKVPGFFLLGADQRPVDGVNGGEWDDDTAANIAPVLTSFLRGTYRRRREAFTPLAPVPPGSTTRRRPRGTFL